MNLLTIKVVKPIYRIRGEDDGTTSVYATGADWVRRGWHPLAVAVVASSSPAETRRAYAVGLFTKWDSCRGFHRPYSRGHLDYLIRGGWRLPQ